MRRALVIVFFLSACGPKDTATSAPSSNAALEDTCKTTLTPRPRDTTPGPPAPPSSPSRMIAHVDVKLAPVTAELEKNIPRRVLDERGHDIGMAGSLNVVVDRGPVATAIEGENLVVRTELRGHVEACAKGSCYASCEPTALATAAVPLRLRPDYRFAPSRVTVSVTRGCQIRALGGFVTIDVTPRLQGLVGPAARRVEQQIDARLPHPHADVERMWTQLNATRDLPLGACALVRPSGLVQGPIGSAPGIVRLRFGLVASPELRTSCGEPPPLTPLPPLAHDPRLPDEDDLVVALVWPLTKVAASITTADPFTFEGARVRATKATATAAGAALDLDLSLRGEACGDVAPRAPVAWTEDGKALYVIDASGPRVPPPVQPDSLRTMIPAVAASVADPRVDVKATVKEAKPLAAWARGQDLVATVRVRGAVVIAPK